jgi:hypothetical protein
LKAMVWSSKVRRRDAAVCADVYHVQTNFRPCPADIPSSPVQSHDDVPTKPTSLVNVRLKAAPPPSKSEPGGPYPHRFLFFKLGDNAGGLEGGKSSRFSSGDRPSTTARSLDPVCRAVNPHAQSHDSVIFRSRDRWCRLHFIFRSQENGVSAPEAI